MECYDNRFTLITGASSGIGRALAVRMSGTRRLILQGRDIARLNETRISSNNPEWHHIWQYELQNIADLAEDLQRFMGERGVGIDCFIHSAGVLKVLPIRCVSHQDVIEIMNVNFVSAVEIISLLMKKRVNGQQLKNIILISSIISSFGAPGFSMYSASKGALDSFMRSLAVELAPTVRVNSILPGAIETDMTKQLLEGPGVLEKLGSDYPLGLGKVCDIAAAVEFLLGDQSRWITGQQLVIDGGRTIKISL